MSGTFRNIRDVNVLWLGEVMEREKIKRYGERREGNIGDTEPCWLLLGFRLF